MYWKLEIVKCFIRRKCSRIGIGKLYAFGDMKNCLRRSIFTKDWGKNWVCYKAARHSHQTSRLTASLLLTLCYICSVYQRSARLRWARNGTRPVWSAQSVEKFSPLDSMPRSVLCVSCLLDGQVMCADDMLLCFRFFSSSSQRGCFIFISFFSYSKFSFNSCLLSLSVSVCLSWERERERDFLYKISNETVKKDGR